MAIIGLILGRSIVVYTAAHFSIFPRLERDKTPRINYVWPLDLADWLGWQRADDWADDWADRVNCYPQSWPR
jgi:hypothetical protein